MHARTPLPVSRSRYERGIASRRRTPARCRTAAKRATTIVANSHQRRCCLRNGQRQGTARCPDEIRSARTAWHCASRRGAKSIRRSSVEASGANARRTCAQRAAGVEAISGVAMSAPNIREYPFRACASPTSI